MSLLACLALPLACALSQPDTAFLDQIAGDAISLPQSDMAQAWPPEVMRRALHVRVTKAGDYAVLDPTSPLTPALDRSDQNDWYLVSLNDLHDHLLMWVDRALDSDEPVRDQIGLSTKHVVIWADENAAWGHVAKTMFFCGKEQVKVGNLWFAARNTQGQIGLLAVTLPRDVGVNAPPDPDPPSVDDVIVSSEKAGRESDAVGAADLYPCFFRWWKAGEKKSRLLNIEADADQPFSAVAAVVSEARRFGFGVSFRGVELDWRGEIATESWFDIPSAPAMKAVAVPVMEPGKALSGDPAKNPITVFPVRRK